MKDFHEKGHLPADQTTQLVVGAGEESDGEIFNRILYEYKELEVKRVYYSAFSPQKGTAFASKNPQPIWREHRLYQMDRVYHFQPREIEHAFMKHAICPTQTLLQVSIILLLVLNFAIYRPHV